MFKLLYAICLQIRHYKKSLLCCCESVLCLPECDSLVLFRGLCSLFAYIYIYGGGGGVWSNCYTVSIAMRCVFLSMCCLYSNMLCSYRNLLYILECFVSMEMCCVFKGIYFVPMRMCCLYRMYCLEMCCLYGDVFVYGNVLCLYVNVLCHYGSVLCL